MEDLPLVLPATPAVPRRPPVPFMAALVPVAAGVVLWLVSGSLYALCFAALGPLMIAASLLDGARSRRREMRRSAAECERAWAQADIDLRRRQDEERDRRWRRHPDAAACLLDPPLRGSDGVDALTEIVVGSGSAPSGIRVSGGEDERSRAFRHRATTMHAAPITVPLGGGICVRGPAPLAIAAARALMVQLCLRFSPAQLALVSERLGLSALEGLPHARSRRGGGFRIGFAVAGDPRPQADAVIWAADRETAVPEGITTVIDMVEPQRATLRTPQGVADLAVEGLSAAQSAAIVQDLAGRGEQTDVLPDAVGLAELDQVPVGAGLPAVIGRGESGDVLVDIVEDGPHAIVTGTTGTGKSELLVSWVTAITRTHGPERVCFVLADFKGGTAFESLRDLPQVVAVITDLDEAGARRGVSSLTAELRRREAEIAAAGVRDVRDVDMPRLIIVVDEFAALLQEHPDLGAVFTDVAARGRALGMHLILGTQRASGVIRDALAANCPLRLSLRVHDPADSRLVIGTDAAAELPGGATSRGLALVRRPQDDQPAAMRVALTSAADLREVAVRWDGSSAPRSPWLPALPRMLPLADLMSPEVTSGTAVLGRADDPQRQEQPLELLRIGEDRGLAVLGAPGTGRTSLLRSLAAQTARVLWVPRDPEQAWDVVTRLSARAEVPPALVLCDDLDLQLAELPSEHAQHLVQRWEQLLRGTTGTTFVIAAARASGPTARLLDAMPRRALLRMPSRVDHLAAGGESDGYERGRPAGRARIGDREVQFAWVAEGEPGLGAVVGPATGEARAWEPRAPSTALVTSAASAVAERLRVAYPECEVLSTPADAPTTTRRCIVVGEAEAWQRSWGQWQRIRGEGEVLIRAECAADLRQLAGVRELPPYARTHAGRAWSLRDADPPQRVVIPALFAS